MGLEDWKADMVGRLPTLRAEYERLGKLIAVVESLTDDAGEPVEDDGATPTPRRRSVSGAGTARAIGPDEFVGMSTSQAVKAFLTLKGKGSPQGPRDMAKAMVTGGRDSDEDKAYANVTSVLKRMNKNGEVKQVRRGQWGLASWYGTSAPPKKPNRPNGEPPED